MQSMDDNEKRMQTHLDGKLHKGYARIRQQLNILRTKRADWRRMQEEKKNRDNLSKEVRTMQEKGVDYEINLLNKK